MVLDWCGCLFSLMSSHIYLWVVYYPGNYYGNPYS